MDILIFTRFFSFAGPPVFPALHECLLYRVGRPNCHFLARSSTVRVQGDIVHTQYHYAQSTGQPHSPLGVLCATTRTPIQKSGAVEWTNITRVSF
eukprot:2039731-Pyramimonas_sp.AAC.2